jgi:hypothetical protein
MAYFHHFRYIPINTITYNVALGMSRSPVNFLTNNLFYGKEIEELLAPNEAARSVWDVIGVTKEVIKTNAKYPIFTGLHMPLFYNPIQERVIHRGRGRPRIHILSSHLEIPKIGFTGTVDFTATQKGRNLMIRTDFVSKGATTKFSEHMYIKPHSVLDHLGKIEYGFEMDGQTMITTSFDTEMNKVAIPGSVIDIHRQLDIVAKKFLK